jgi:hypothetical protein
MVASRSRREGVGLAELAGAGDDRRVGLFGFEGFVAGIELVVALGAAGGGGDGQLGLGEQGGEGVIVGGGVFLQGAVEGGDRRRAGAFAG